MRVDFQGLHEIIDKDGHIFMFIVDRKGAATNKNGLRLNKLLNSRDLFE